jgi:hypothetical protein
VSENLVGDTLFEFSQGSDLVPTHGAVNMSVVGMILPKVEFIIAAHGAI